MSQGGNDVKQAPKIRAKTIGKKFSNGTEKIKSLYSFARIYKVPEDLRKLNECAYVPRLIAIGPLHRKGKHLRKPMQDDSSSIPQPINGGKGGSKSNRRGCEPPRADPICDSILTANIVRHDLMLLENQIPFFVLEHLFQLTVAKIPTVDQTTGCCPELSLEGYVRSYFSKFLSLEGEQSSGSKPETSCCLASDHCILSVCGSTKELEQGETESGKANDYYHILHLIHSSYIPGKIVDLMHSGYIPVEEGEETELRIQLNSTKHCELTLSASDLHYAGVKFVPTGTKELSDIKFINKGIGCWRCRTLAFRIPTIYIRKTTESFLRNVIALEQCSPGVPRYFTSYARLMDMFINSEEDVRVLKKDRVIHNYLSTDEDVRDLFNKLCKEVVLEDFHFYKDCREASRFNMRWQTRAVRYVTRLFIANPWPTLAFFLGIAGFAIAVYQFGSLINRARYRR
ncbi:hypothetical protein C3L33_20424, partial [Rhododendron williamsianum]